MMTLGDDILEGDTLEIVALEVADLGGDVIDECVVRCSGCTVGAQESEREERRG